MVTPPRELLDLLRRHDRDVQSLALRLRAVVVDELAPCHEYGFAMRSKVALLYSGTPHAIQDGICQIAVFSRHALAQLGNDDAIFAPEHDQPSHMSHSYPLPVTNKMKGGMLAAGIGTVFLIFGTVILDTEQSPKATTAFYVMGASAIVIGAAVFLRDFRMERKRRRHVRRKGGRRRGQDWKPQIEVNSRRDADLKAFLDTGLGDDEDPPSDPR